jgi:GNAT superfamily N-acetyltransferase
MELTRADGLFISDDPDLVDAERVVRWICDESWWGKGRPRDVMERAIAGSHVYGVYADRETMIGVTRVVSDHSTFTYFCDVFIDDAYRGKGVGPWLTQAIVDEHRALGVKRFLLATKDKHAVYAKAGFVPVANPQIWMEIDERPILKAYSQDARPDHG